MWVLREQPCGCIYEELGNSICILRPCRMVEKMNEVDPNCLLGRLREHWSFEQSLLEHRQEEKGF